LLGREISAGCPSPPGMMTIPVQFKSIQFNSTTPEMTDIMTDIPEELK
jgi:hypothetical protein